MPRPFGDVFRVIAHINLPIVAFWKIPEQVSGVLRPAGNHRYSFCTRRIMSGNIRHQGHPGSIHDCGIPRRDGRNTTLTEVLVPNDRGVRTDAYIARISRSQCRRCCRHRDCGFLRCRTPAAGTGQRVARISRQPAGRLCAARRLTSRPTARRRACRRISGRPTQSRGISGADGTWGRRKANRWCSSGRCHGNGSGLESRCRPSPCTSANNWRSF